MHVLHSERCSEMKETEIRKYAELMKELGLSGLEITEDNSKVRLEYHVSVPAKDMTYAVADIGSSGASVPENKDYVSVRSPLVGVFYAAPAENAAPYVSVGDHVTKGQTLCIVEAMKLMNEITAEEDGTIAEICMTNGQIVEFGTELFRLKR